MPTYVYECQRCGHEFELFQPISGPPRKRCPVCRGKVQRRFGTGSGLLFNGAGFHATDYRSPDYAKHAEAEHGRVAPSKAGVAAPSMPVGKKRGAP